MLWREERVRSRHDHKQDSLSVVNFCYWIFEQKNASYFFKTLFFLKAYQNLYVKPQPSNKEFMQWRWQQQLLTFNTLGSKCHSCCSIKYSVLTGNNQQTLKKKKKSILLISSLRLTLLIVLLNNLPISIDVFH